VRGEENMKKFTKKVVVVAISAVITVASAGMAFGNNYARRSCPECGGAVETSRGTLTWWTEREPCDHGYEGVMDTVDYRIPVFRSDCVDVDCKWYEDFIEPIEEMSRMCDRIR
jgi:hypothetical protein